FWLAEALFRKGDFRSASQAYAKLVHDFPTSSRRLEAAIGEAAALGQAGNPGAVIDLLQDPNGVLQIAVRNRATNDVVASGFLLLSEAFLARQKWQEAEKPLDYLARFPLSPALAWRRQHLLCRIFQAQGRSGDVLAGATNLVALAMAAG